MCKKIVAFFALLSKTQESGVQKLGVTQELLSLVTGLAHYLKLLIRIGLQGALKLEREQNSPHGLHRFLDTLGDLESLQPIEAEREALGDDASASLLDGLEHLADQRSDCCVSCNEPIDDECIMRGDQRWHIKPPHLNCAACQNDLTTNPKETLWSSREQRPFCSICAIQKNFAPDAQGGFAPVSKLQQFVFLLRVALARLLAVLRAGGSLGHAPGMST